MGRKNIGLFFSYNENWIGGTYYMMNLIEAIKLLPENDQPHLSIFYDKIEDQKKILELQYPFIDFIQTNNNDQFIKRALRFLSKKIIKKDIFQPQLVKKIALKYYDGVFPLPFGFTDRLAKKNIYWIPDFQEMYFPEFFSIGQLNYRKHWQNKIAASNNEIVFSSKDAHKDFVKLYPRSKAKQYIIPFAVTHPDYQQIDLDSVVKKYQLPENYFFCPNQFWMHKNQLIVLEAIRTLQVAHNKDVTIVFSGKISDAIQNNYFGKLEEYTIQNNMANNVLFLGFIDRKEQLLIMKHALAVIQPSLFEGWSTVIEDAKAMDQNIIASNLAVHIEQLNEKAVYFDPHDSNSLVKALLQFEKKQVAFDYKKNKMNFATAFINMINE
ncbi:MAG TPA: glycosyltransferase family 1 protein [Ferruginibacter sp.]|nr:glycosyltransferase family 1 protein [Ferruginibacter sp.]